MIEHYEDPAMNWRRSYHTGLEIKINDLRRERSAGGKRQIWLDHKRYSVATLTDSKLEEIARRELERDMNRAIIEHREKQARQRMRNGLAQ